MKIQELKKELESFIGNEVELQRVLGIDNMDSIDLGLEEWKNGNIETITIFEESNQYLEISISKIVNKEYGYWVKLVAVEIN